MAYFAALLARSGSGWTVSDVDLDEVEDLDSLVEVMRESAEDDEPVLLLLEQEDSWFGIVRVDGEDDPRVFVSDPSAATRSAYGEILLSAEGIDYEGNAYDEDEEEGRPASEPVGDTELLADLGTPETELLGMVNEDGLLPTEALDRIAAKLGCAEELESLR